MNLPKKGDIQKPKQKQQEHTIINNLEETETIDLLSFKNKKNVEEKTNELAELGIKQQKNYQKVLFICSGLENTITNQQNITIIYQMVNEMLKDDWNVSILTSTDAIKLAVPDECNVIQDKIEFSTILHLAKKENFDLIVPLIEDEEEQKINKKTSLYRISQNLIPHLPRSTKILQQDLLTSGRTMLSYKSIAKIAEFIVPRRFEKIDDFICTNINVVCIKDKFNQVILDVQESGKINGKQFIISPTKTLKSNVYKLLIDKIYRFGENIDIVGVPYTIKISILRDVKDRKCIEIGNLEEVKEDKFEYKMYFRDIKFGFGEEVIFAIQQKNINFGDVLYKIYTGKVLADVEDKHRFAYTYNYQKTYKIGYFVKNEDFDKTCIKQFNKTNHDIIANCRLFDDLLKTDEDIQDKATNKPFFANDDVNGNIVFQSKAEDYLYSKITNAKEQNKYLLCFFDDQTSNSINQQIVFYRLCKNIAEELNLKTILITNYTLPISFVGDFDYIHICDEVNDDVVKDLQNHYNTKYTFLTPNEKMSGLIEIIEANEMKIFGLDYKDTFIYQKDEKIYRKLGLSIHSLYRNNLEGGETIFKLLAVKDQHKNYFLNDFISTEFVGYIGKFCNFIPANISNYYIEPKVRKASIDTMNKIQSSGVVQISFTYKEGNIFLYDVSQLFDQNIFVLNNLPYSIMFKIITLAITGRNIDLISRQNSNGKYMKFFQRINFEMSGNNTATMEDVSKNRVLRKIEKFLKN